MTAANPTGDRSTALPRRTGLAVVVALLVVQVLVAVVMALGPRPSPYGWQMYSAVPFKPDAWAVHGEVAEPLNVDEMLVHPRVEIDYVALLRSHGCAFASAGAMLVGYALLVMAAVTGAATYLTALLERLGAGTGPPLYAALAVVVTIGAAVLVVLGVRLSARIVLLVETLSITLIVVVFGVLLAGGVPAGGTPLVGTSLQVAPSNRQRSSATSTRSASVLSPPP